MCFEKLNLPDVRVAKTDVVLDGGNVIKCEDSVIMTDKIFYENRNYDKVVLMNELERCFGSDGVVRRGKGACLDWAGVCPKCFLKAL